MITTAQLREKVEKLRAEHQQARDMFQATGGALQAMELLLKDSESAPEAEHPSGSGSLVSWPTPAQTTDTSVAVNE